MAKTAFEAERETLWKLDPEHLTIVGIDTDDGLEHPLVNHRVLKLKETGPDPDMVDSLLTLGQLQPIMVRKNGSFTEVVLGRNRVLAAREANARLLKADQEPMVLRCVLRKDNEDAKLTGAIAAENGVRHEDDMLTKAREAQRLIERGKMSKLQIAKSLGMKTVEVLDNHLKLLELNPKMQAAIERGVLTATAAATFTDLTQQEQEQKVEEIEKLGIVLSVPEARRQKKARNAVKKGKVTKEVSTRGKGVAIGVLRKVADDEKFIDDLDQTAKNMLRWIIGEGSHRSVPGLGAALRRAGELDGED